MYNSSCWLCVHFLHWCFLLFYMMRLLFLYYIMHHIPPTLPIKDQQNHTFFHSLYCYYCNLLHNTFWEPQPTPQAGQSFALLFKTNLLKTTFSTISFSNIITFLMIHYFWQTSYFSNENSCWKLTVFLWLRLKRQTS